MKLKYVAIILSCILLTACGGDKSKPESSIHNSTKETSHKSTSESSIDADSRIDIGTEINPIKGNKSDFDKLDKNTQDTLKNYLAAFYVATLTAIEKQDIVYNYKDDYIKKFENEFDSLVLTYENDKTALNVISDFYQLSYICAVYEARILHSDLVASDYGSNNTVIIDEAYTQYMKDLTDILTNLTNEYLN